MRVVIVGGGLIGCTLAWALARRSARVVVLERGVVGGEASSAAAGILAPRIEAHGDPVNRELGVRALARWVDLAAELPAEVGFRRCGVLRVVHDGEDRTPPDPDAVWLDPEAARAREPALSPRIAGAWHLPDESVVDTRGLTYAVRRAAELAGARFLVGREVEAVEPGGVRAAGGFRHEGVVVVCAGAWSGGLPGLPRVPVRPVRGQLVAVRGVTLSHLIFGTGGYLVPRADEVVVGATVEDVGFTRGLSVAGVHHVLNVAMAHVPALRDATFDRAWSGFRPGTPDSRPLVGKVGETWVASGHYRNGILLAPLTADLLTSAILDRAPLPDAWSPRRFSA